MRTLYQLLFLLISICAQAQIVPDLTEGNHFLPGLTEAQKQELVIRSFRSQTKHKPAQTSQELYPHLYQYVNKDHFPSSERVPGHADAKGFSVPAIRLHAPSAPVIPSIPIIPNDNQLSVDERNRQSIAADLAAYEARQTHNEQLVKEALGGFAPEIIYHLGANSSHDVDRYMNAHDNVADMLSGKQPVDFLRAVWLVESAADPALSWKEFNGMFQEGVQIITALMRLHKVAPDDNLGKIMSIFQYMADTTRVFVAAKEKTVLSKPMLYDFDDYAGERDPTKVFVSKLLRTGTGQCMSLPMLFFLYARALGAEVNLAFAPEHTYITFRDNLAKRQNIELTGRMFTSTDFHWQNGFVKAEQVKSGIYLTPLSEKETLAYLVTTLAKTYVKSYGVDNNLLEMATLAKQYDGNSLEANMLLAGYSFELWKHVLRQYRVYGLSERQLARDRKAQAIKNNKEAAYNYLMKDLGYAKMPAWAYQSWLNGVNEIANQRQHVVKKRQLEQQLKK